MSSSHSSRLLLVLVAIVCTAGVAGAVTVSDSDTVQEAEVGTTVETSVTLTELFRDPSTEQWTLETETELSNVTWSFELVDQAGNTIETTTATGQTASQELDLDSNVAELTVEVTGDVPTIENYSYEPAHTFLLAELRHTQPGGTSSTIETYEVHHYTEESDEASEAIESAEEAIEAAGGSDEAEETLESAISAYEGENFENAVTLAQRAEREAGQAQQSQQFNQLLIFAGIALVAILVIVGAVYIYLQNRQTSRL